MSGSENGSIINSTEQQGSVTGRDRTLSARSASPAKRSAADMEGAGNARTQQTSQQAVAGGSQKAQSDGDSDLDGAKSVTTCASNSMEDTQTTTSSGASSTLNTSSTSLQSNDAPPPYTEDDAWRRGSSKTSGKTLPSIDEQVKEISEIAMAATLDEGTRGYVISAKWLGRVQARSSEGLSNSDFSKEAREGEIGPVDNSDIVLEGGFASTLTDGSGTETFVPLRPGLSMGDHFEVLPEKAWGKICEWYGLTQDQKRIVRYAHNTAEPPQQNILYELYPPVFTIRKVPQPGREAERPLSAPQSVEALRLKKERAARGQLSPDDAIKLVSSRSERFQKFLARSKEAASIPRNNKVKIWRLLDPAKVTIDKPSNQQQAVMSPPPSRSASPVKPVQSTATKLIVPANEFKDMEIGKHLEHVDAKDETNNSNYNGSSTMDTYGLYEDQTLLLEEQMGGPGGGEFASDNQKRSSKIFGKKLGSKPGSTTASGRTSPVPGGMTTRGRARRDGRTRGTVGLTNLGNTCYMNSALQCIRSVEELAIYFLAGKYKSEINASNPLGHGGAMAKSYAGVLQSIYGDQTGGAFTPSQFKKTLGSIQPLFSGYGQQDSQEFLSFLVDALHEDLNRILKKPYNENPDSDDKTVHDPQAIIKLGETYRTNHRARNDSIAMDLFSGFYKNTMECPVCEKISITFDPYSLITVQLPIESTVQHTITFVPLDGLPINHLIDMDKNSSIKTVKESIASKHPGVTASRLWMIEVYNHKIYKVFENQHSLAEANIQANDIIFVFELPNVPTNIPEPSKFNTSYTGYTLSSSRDKQVPEMDSPKAENFAVPVFSRQKNRFGSGWDITMHPLYIMVTREEAQNYDIILKKVLIAVSRQTSRPILTENDQDKGRGTEAATNGDTEKDESAGEEAGRISDRSVPSEDGYVEVSIDKTDAPVDESAAAKEVHSRPIPPGFMDPEYHISPALRNQLFALGYARSAEGMLCTGMQSIENAKNMFDRVKQPVRRASMQSSSSEDTTTSTGSNQVNGETEESDADDDEDKPDLVLGSNEESLHLPTPTTATVEDSDNDSLPEDPLKGFQNRGGRGKANKFKNGNKGRKNKTKTYGKKSRFHHGRPGSRGSLGSTQSQRSLSKHSQQDDNPYYIKLGEGIVLDWYPEALDSLFNGDPNVPDDLRGHWLSDADGKSLQVLHDPVLEEKQKKRAARKKHGITLEDCFVETGKREILSEDNAWYCNRCKEMRQAAKTLEIWTIPDILIVHLKRFGGNRSFRDKIDVLVDYPIEGLDMTEKVGFKDGDKEYIYDLFAVDNHYGGLGGGHYTALAKNFYDGQWYDYNDSMCSKVGDAKLRSPAAYLLFYRRRSDKPLGPQYLQDLVTEFRNPPATESATEDAEESDSGEGRLGGPTSSLHGSSSALTVAGAGTSANLRSTASGDGPGAGSLQTRKGTTKTGQQSDEDGDGGQLPPPHESGYGNQGNDTWGFSGLDQDGEADGDATETLLDNLSHPNDDTGSMIVDFDSAVGTDVGDDLDNRMEQDFGDTQMFSLGNDSAGRGTPVHSIEMEDLHDRRDDHSLYNGARMDQSHGAGELDSLHLEDAGAMGDASPPAVEIHVGGDDDDSIMGGMHSKMD